MTEFSIKIFEFGLLVDRPGGLTVLFPENEHVLTLTSTSGVNMPLKPGASVTLSDANGVPLAATPTTVANPNAFVFDLPEALGKEVQVRPDLLTSGSVDTALNARVVLSGGTLTELDCFVQPGKQWTFADGTIRAVTDSAIFRHDIQQDGEVCLNVNGVLLEISAGEEFTLTNADALGSPTRQFIELAEFEALCGLTTASDIAFPLSALRPDSNRFEPRGAFHVLRKTSAMAMPKGTDNVCAIASIKSSL